MGFPLGSFLLYPVCARYLKTFTIFHDPPDSLAKLLYMFDFSGNGIGGRRAASPLGFSTGRVVQIDYALALLFAEDDRRAQTLADDLGNRFPEDTIVQFNCQPTLHARIAINRENATQALESPRIAVPCKLGVSTASAYAWTPLYPVIVRAEASLAARQGSEAVPEFQKILDHPGIVVNEPIGVLAHLGLARAYVLQGESAKASAKYQDILALSKDADPAIPVLIAAKSECAKIK
jgi:predicted Zn-dependent protease